MKLAFTTCNPNGLDSMVCPWDVASFLVIVELKDGEVGEVETVSGFQSFFYSQPFAQGLEDVDALITASFTPYAPVPALSGVKIYLAPPYTTVRRALEMYREGKLKGASSLWQAPSQPPAAPFFVPQSAPQFAGFSYPVAGPQVGTPVDEKRRFREMLERQLWVLRQQKWLLETERERIDKELKIIEEQIEKIKDKLKSLD